MISSWKDHLVGNFGVLNQNVELIFDNSYSFSHFQPNWMNFEALNKQNPDCILVEYLWNTYKIM